MKQRSLFFAALFSLLALASCKKDREKDLPPFQVPVNVQFTIPEVSGTDAEVSLNLNPLSFNLDSVVRANAGNGFDAKDVNIVYIRQIVVTLLDASNASNAANFEYAKVAINNGSGPLVVGSTNLNDTYATYASLQTPNDLNLKNHLQGNVLQLSMAVKARRVTERPLQAHLSAFLEFVD